MEHEHEHEHVLNMSIFTETTNDAGMSSVDDIRFEHSDVDSTTSDHSLDEDSPKDYWFGRKYFECVLAQNILQNSRLYDSVAQVDVSLSSLELQQLTLPAVTIRESCPEISVFSQLDKTSCRRLGTTTASFSGRPRACCLPCNDVLHRCGRPQG